MQSSRCGPLICIASSAELLTELQKQERKNNTLQLPIFMQVISVTVKGGDHICTL